MAALIPDEKLIILGSFNLLLQIQMQQAMPVRSAEIWTRAINNTSSKAVSHPVDHAVCFVQRACSTWDSWSTSAKFSWCEEIRRTIGPSAYRRCLLSSDYRSSRWYRCCCRCYNTWCCRYLCFIFICCCCWHYLLLPLLKMLLLLSFMLLSLLLYCKK